MLTSLPSIKAWLPQGSLKTNKNLPAILSKYKEQAMSAYTRINNRDKTISQDLLMAPFITSGQAGIIQGLESILYPWPI